MISYFAQQLGGGCVHAGVIGKIYREAFFKKEKKLAENELGGERVGLKTLHHTLHYLND